MGNFDRYIFRPFVLVVVPAMLGTIAGDLMIYGDRTKVIFISDLPSTIGFISGLAIGFALFIYTYN